MTDAEQVFLYAVSVEGPDDWEPARHALGQLQTQDWNKVEELASFHGVLGRVSRSLDWAAARFGIDVPIAAALGRMRSFILAENLIRKSAARELATALTQQGLPIVLFKGAALAQEVFGDLSLRTFRDCDILVKTGDADIAFGIARDLGYEPVGYATPADAMRANDRAISMTLSRKCHLDLHWNIASREIGALPSDIIWRECEPPSAPALPGLRLSPELTLIFLSLDFYRSDFVDFKALVDFHAAALALRGRVDPQKLHRIAGLFGVRPIVDLAARLCCRTFKNHPAIARLAPGAPSLRTRLACRLLTPRRLIASDARDVLGNHARRLLLGGRLTHSLRATARLLAPGRIDLEQRFGRPYTPGLYPRYYGQQALRIALRAKRVFRPGAL